MKHLVFISTIFIVAIVLLSNWGGHYNYGVNREGSPILFENPYSSDDNEEYEFYSTLYELGVSNGFFLVHLSDVYNHDGIPKETWRQSRFSFRLPLNSEVELIPDSVKLEHYSKEGMLIKPIRVVSKLSSKCSQLLCSGYLHLHYSKGIPRSIIEKVSFTIKVQGKEELVSYTIPLEYKYEYSFWDVLMGV